MKTVVSCGGSVASAYGEGVETTFGKIFAEKIKCKHELYAKAKAGNDRAHKLVIINTVNNRLKKGDIILYQLSDYTRIELPFISNKKNNSHYFIQGRSGVVKSFYNTYDWCPTGFGDAGQDVPKFVEAGGERLKAYHNVYDDMQTIMADNTEYFKDDWLVKGRMFQSFCEDYGLVLIPFVHTSVQHLCNENDNLLKKYFTKKNYKRIFWEPEVWPYGEFPMSYSCGDGIHYNNSGHQIVAKQLYKHYKSVFR